MAQPLQLATSMRSSARFAIALCSTLAGCKPQASAPREPAPATAPGPPVAAVEVPRGPVVRDVDVKMPGGDTAKVRVKVPGDWEPITNGVGKRNESGEVVSGVELMVTCDGACDAQALPGNLAAHVASAPESAARPNLNTGSAELDAVRLDVVTLAKEDLPDGKLVVFRVSKPKGVEGPYREGVRCVAARLHPDGARFVVAQAWISLAAEKELGQTLHEVCRGFDVAR